jgi:hypothetical protein
MHSRLQQALLGLIVLSAPSLHAASFVYEGQLDDRGAPANGRYDIQLAVYGDVEFGATLSTPVVFNSVEVVGGRFRLDFEAELDGVESAWVELALRDAGGSGFSAIPGRTKATQAPAAIGACWSSVGDSGSNPATHFLGTTDAQPLVLRTANVQSLRLEPSAELFGGNPITANVIAGSSQNFVTAGVRGATIAGGGVPLGDSDPVTVGEGPNRAADSYGSIGGGYANVVGNDAGTTIDRVFATVSGGIANVASGRHSAIGGGSTNSASGQGATVGGGTSNDATAADSSVAGGFANTASGTNSAIGGGQSNMASGGNSSTVSGGGGNSASADSSTVSGGYFNCAGGDFSWAGGSQAKVRPGSGSGAPGFGCAGVALSGDADGDAGSFVWADNQFNDFTSTGNDQFAIRARGGLRWGGTGTNSTTSPAFIHQTIVGTNTCDGGSGAGSRTYLNHPLLNNNPDAVIVLTPNYGSTAGGGAAPPRNPIGLYYNATTSLGCPAARWVIYQLTTTADALNNGARFNTWFVLP